MVDMPTRNHSILDLIITNNVAAITNIHTVNTLISDHLIVACTYSFCKTKVEPRFKFVRNYNKINCFQFGHDVLNIEEKYLSSCDEQLSFFNTSLLQVFNKHCNLFESVKNTLLFGKNTCEMNKNNNVNDINSHFANICKKTQESPEFDYNHPASTNPFVLKQVTNQQIIKVWRQMKNKENMKEDETGICNKMIHLTIYAPNITSIIC